MAEENLKRSLDQALDAGSQFPDRLLLSRTMANLRAQYLGGGAGLIRARRSRRSSPRFRSIVTLVGAILVVALVAGLVLGGHLWRQLSSPTPSVNQSELAALEARPLNWHAVPASDACPASPLVDYPNEGMAIGPGPVWIYSNDTPVATSWGGWAVYKFAYTPRAPGLVLIRAKNLQTTQTVAFAQNPLGPSSMSSTGRVLGTDDVLGHTTEARSEVVFRDSAHTAAINANGERAPLTVMIGLQRGSSRCVGLQADGPGFTEDIVIQWSGSGL